MFSKEPNFPWKQDSSHPSELLSSCNPAHRKSIGPQRQKPVLKLQICVLLVSLPLPRQTRLFQARPFWVTKPNILRGSPTYFRTPHG